MVARKPKIEHENNNADIDLFKMGRESAKQELDALKAKQSSIAECYKFIGRIQAAEMIEKFGNVSTLVWLKDVKESKLYREISELDTWDKFCESLGKSRRMIDEQLANLETLGTEFLETVSSLRVGYRDLKKLRLLKNDGTLAVESDALIISGERIPLDVDHKEDLQAAIEKIIEEQDKIKEDLKAQKKAFDRVQDDTRKSVLKLQKENDQLQERAKARGLTLEEDAFITRVAGFRDMAQGALIALDPNAEENLIPDNLSMRMKSALIASIHMIKMQVSAIYDSVIAQIGDPVMNPELLEDFTRWEKENGFNPNSQPTIKAAE